LPSPQTRRRAWRFSVAGAPRPLAALLAFFVMWTAAVAAQDPVEAEHGPDAGSSAGGPASTGADDPEAGESPESVLTERVTVTASRLPARAEDEQRVPAGVTVLDRQRIESSTATTVQDLLASETGIVLYDQVGNDVQKTLDLRGFSDGSGTRVFLDGAPLNDPRNNALALHLIPLATLERVEIIRGSAATLAGGGSEGGVIHLTTRRAEDLGGSLTLAAGSDAARRFGGDIGQRAGRWSFGLSGSWEESDGFRENAGVDLRRLGGSVRFDIDGRRQLDLSFIDASSRLGNPGALTEEELEDAPDLAPFNLLDFSDEQFTQAALNFRGALAGSWSLAANLFFTDRATRSLTTGRAAPLYGGFFLDLDGSTAGSTLQIAQSRHDGDRRNDLILGMEWLEGDTDAGGFSTTPDDPGTVNTSDPASRNRTDRRTGAVYLQETWSPGAEWTLTGGLRLDHDRVGYDEAIPDGSNADSRTFSELSLRAGATWNVASRLGLHASYGESFLPPTAEQLFAFPTFGSNPDLLPEDSRTWEAGLRARWPRSVRLDVTLFLVDTTDEIIFDPDSALGLFGANVNAGRSRRQGIEGSLRGRLSSRLDGFLNATWTDAEFRNGPNEGNRLPLVPRQRLAAGLVLELPAGVALRAEARHVGEQVLDNDEENGQERLAAYTVVDAKLTWSPAGLAGARTGRLLLFGEVTNLLDEQYATRGIYAFDFSAGADNVFLTPAPDRRFLAGLTWRL
jgi:iron complex outermembrane receptor protein